MAPLKGDFTYKVILVYSALIYTIKNKEPNYTKCISNDSAALYILGYKYKSTSFSEKGKIRLK